jgi:hypothetical protein
MPTASGRTNSLVDAVGAESPISIDADAVVPPLVPAVIVSLFLRCDYQ